VNFLVKSLKVTDLNKNRSYKKYKDFVAFLDVVSSKLWMYGVTIAYKFDILFT